MSDLFNKGFKIALLACVGIIAFIMLFAFALIAPLVIDGQICNDLRKKASNFPEQYQQEYEERCDATKLHTIPTSRQATNRQVPRG